MTNTPTPSDTPTPSNTPTATNTATETPTPDVYYALPFVTVEPYADAQGEHYGTHPCAAVRMTAAEFEALREAITP